METVTIGCRLPNGYVLEVGYDVTAKMGDGVVTQYRRRNEYRRYTLGGTHAHTLGVRKAGIAVPSMLNPEPFINRNVPKDLWDAWLKGHREAWVVKSGQIFEVTDGRNESNIAATALDAKAKSAAILQPLDPSKAVLVGGDKVEVADFEPNVKAAAKA